MKSDEEEDVNDDSSTDDDDEGFKEEDKSEFEQGTAHYLDLYHCSLPSCSVTPPPPPPLFYALSPSGTLVQLLARAKTDLAHKSMANEDLTIYNRSLERQVILPSFPLHPSLHPFVILSLSSFPPLPLHPSLPPFTFSMTIAFLTYFGLF